MKTEELRIGNYVKETVDNKAVTIASIIQVERDIFDFEVKDSDGIFIDVGDQIEPIPLTEEWLIKFGFEIYCDSSNYLSIYVENIGILYWSINEDLLRIEVLSRRNTSKLFKHVKSVHQLQNLYFALTGKELTIH